MLRFALVLAVGAGVLGGACSSFEGAPPDPPLPARDAGASDGSIEADTDADATADGARARYLYIFGGNDYKLPNGAVPYTKTTYRARIAADGELGGWEAVAELELAVTGAAFASPASDVVVASGGIPAVGDQRGNATAAVRAASLVDPVAGWANGPPLGTDHAMHSMLTIGSVLVVIGGANAGGVPHADVLTTTYAAGGGTGIWSYAGNTPEPISSASAAVLGDRIFVAGGITNSTLPATFARYISWTKLRADLTVEPFTTAGVLPTALAYPAGHSLVAVGEHLVLVGGTSVGNTGITDVFVGDVANDGTVTWKATTPSRFPTRSGCVVVVGDAIYVLGGQSSDATKEAERGVLQPNGAIDWKPARELPEPRVSFGCVVR